MSPSLNSAPREHGGDDPLQGEVYNLAGVPDNEAGGRHNHSDKFFFHLQLFEKNITIALKTHK